MSRRATEDTPLLASVQSNAANAGAPAASVRQRSQRQRHCIIVTTVSIVAFVAVILVLSNALVNNPNHRPTKMSKSTGTQSPVSDATTFAELAQQVIPELYQEMIPSLQLFETSDPQSIHPGDVYRTRKLVLKTRDLLDIFSPVYPNNTQASNDTQSDSTTDVWWTLRKQLDAGYELLGHFLDLDHSHVNYTQEMAQEARRPVLDWYTSFSSIQDMYKFDDFVALSSTPPGPASYRHAKESRFFWKLLVTSNNRTEPINRPQTTDPASSALCTLGRLQLQAARSLWNNPVRHFDNVLAANRHEDYHSFRKALRSINDEYMLLGFYMFPDTSTVSGAMENLNSARQILGDINDDYTAYSIYTSKNKYPKEQERLEHEIDNAWVSFLKWAKDDCRLERAMITVEEAVCSTTMTLAKASLPSQCHAPNQSLPTLLEFLDSHKDGDSINNIVIGNEAGDADSIVSAIALAYVESVIGTESRGPKTPIISIPRADFASQRPETYLLLELAGVSNPEDHLHFVSEHGKLQNVSFPLDVTLVDHNLMTPVLVRHKSDHFKVVEIVDHHVDRRHYKLTCPGPPARTVAFVHGSALVASTCTLVAERLKVLCTETPYPFSIGLLLLGVILLDSVNLSPDVGKVTGRDIKAVKDLLHHTDWDLQQMSTAAKTALGAPLETATVDSWRPNTTTLFQALQDAKYSPSFWKSLSAEDALWYDYKDFSCGSTKKAAKESITFGVATILMPFADFVQKMDTIVSVKSFLGENDISLLVIMFAYQQEGKLHRELVFCSMDSELLNSLLDYLWQEGHGQELLQLRELPVGIIADEDSGQLQIRYFVQDNVQPSRKQIGPILQQYFCPTHAAILG